MCVRSFFTERGFLEVETPYLQRYPNLDPNVGFLRLCSGEFLHTSPEYGMKKLLAAGFESIFQICRVFRDDEQDALHLREFTMLEWYAVGKDYHWLIEFAMDLLLELAERWGVLCVSYREREAVLNGDYEIFSLERAFLEAFGVSIADAQELEALVSLAKAKGVPYDRESWYNTFHLIYLNLFEPEIAKKNVPVFVVDYPECMAAMASLRRDRPWLAERVELVVCGVELMNGYTELTDAKEQERRLSFEAKRLGLGEVAVDRDFIEAVSVMPSCAGAALGMDRLFMLFEGKDSLDGVTFR